MNYTDKYHLPQWEETDRIMRADFNQMCADMEAGLEKNAQAAAGALSAANSKPTSAAVNRAQSTADQALRAANAAYSPDFKPFATGTYTGQGPDTDFDVPLGFRPSFVIITSQAISEYNETKSVYLSGGNMASVIRFTATGFQITPDRNRPRMGLYTEGQPYWFIAFR